MIPERSGVLPEARPSPVAGKRPPRVAYIMSRFPKLTETFVLFEMGAVESQGVEVALYPLRFERSATVHAEAARWIERGHFGPLLSPAVAADNLLFLIRRPARYLGALATLVRSTFGSPRYLAGGLIFFPRAVVFARQMEREGIEHVHAHFASHPAAVAWVIHRLTGIPYSFTAHGSDLHCDRHMLRQKVSEAAFTVTISEFNRRVIEEECGPASTARVDIIHCGVDTRAFQPPTTADRDPARAPMVLCVGTLHEVKGQAYLLEACRILADRGLRFECHLVGDGPDQPKLERLAQRLGIAGRLVFRGRMTQTDVRVLMRSAAVVVAPSVPTRDGRREGIPVALMEAMASGRPVVASRLSGIPELVEHGVSGLLAEPRDARGLADAIGQILADPDLGERYGWAGRAMIEQEFDLEGTAARLAKRFRRSVGHDTA